VTPMHSHLGVDVQALPEAMQRHDFKVTLAALKQNDAFVGQAGRASQLTSPSHA
jgi:hypothetical protein